MELSQCRLYAVLPASDVERAKEWYRDKLDLKPAEEEMGSAWYSFADGSWAIVTPSQYAGTAQNTAAGWSVTGIENVMEDLRAQGVEFLEYDMGDFKTENGLVAMGPYKACWFKDSEGNILELSEVGATS